MKHWMKDWKKCGLQPLRKVFEKDVVPQDIFSDMLLQFDNHCTSEEDLRFVASFLLEIVDTFDFEDETLLVCSEIDNVRLEKLGRRIKKIDEALAKTFTNNLVDQDWPETKFI